MISRRSAISIIRKNIEIITEQEKIDTLNSLGRILAEDVISTEFSPLTNVSAVDGFALRIEDIKAAINLPVQGVVPAGEKTNADLIKIKKGMTVQVMTGAVLPRNSAAIVKIEDVTLNNSQITMTKDKIHRHRNIRDKGEDIRPGTLILSKRTQINFGEISVLLSCGKIHIQVYKLPRIGVVSTGDELVDYREKPDFYQKREVNSWALYLFLKSKNMNVTRYDVIRDDFAETKRNLEMIAANNDILMVSGGISKGKYDFVKKAIEQVGFKILFHGVNQKPGKPFAFGIAGAGRGKKYFFGLPGNPVATISVALLTVIPILHFMQTGVYSDKLSVKCRLINNFQKADIRMEFARGIFYKKSGKVMVLKNQSSGVISSLVRGNAFVILPSNRRFMRRGETVNVLPFDIL